MGGTLVRLTRTHIIGLLVACAVLAACSDDADRAAETTGSGRPPTAADIQALVNAVINPDRSIEDRSAVLASPLNETDFTQLDNLVRPLDDDIIVVLHGAAPLGQGAWEADVELFLPDASGNPASPLGRWTLTVVGDESEFRIGTLGVCAIMRTFGPQCSMPSGP